MPRVIHFEVCADDPERAVRFYQEAFGWDIRKWNGPMAYWLVQTGEAPEPGINGAIMERMPGVGTVNTVEIHNLEEALEKVKEAGGNQLGSIQQIPDVGRFSYVLDSEGNPLGLMEPISEAV
jgi:predicted enzyme related to lactoylglutathione lyase